MTVLNKLKTLESLMADLSAEMRHSNAINTPMYAHGLELLGASITIRTWIDGMEEEWVNYY